MEERKERKPERKDNDRELEGRRKEKQNTLKKESSGVTTSFWEVQAVHRSTCPNAINVAKKQRARETPSSARAKIGRAHV